MTLRSPTRLVVSPLGGAINAKSSAKSACDIADLWIGKDYEGNEFAYLLAGIDKERQEKYGELIYAHTIYPSAITALNRIGRFKWGFLSVKKLPRWRKLLRSGIGFLTLVGGTTLLTPFMGLFLAIPTSAVAAIGTRKLVTLGRYAKFSAETTELHLTNGRVPKRDYMILQRLVTKANCRNAVVNLVAY